MTANKPLIKWHLEKRKVGELKEFESNPRIMSNFMLEQLKDTIIEDGIIDKPYINTDNVIIGGHQRKKAFCDLGIEEVECWIPHRTLTPKEVKRINIRGNKISGEFDSEKLLAMCDSEELLKMGYTDVEVSAFFDGWDSDISDGPETAPKESTVEFIKLEIPLGTKDEYIAILQGVPGLDKVTII